MSPSYEYYPHTKAAPPDPRDARIAALEATVARLTAEVTKADAFAFDDDMSAAVTDEEHEAYGDIKAALTAFLERRIKG